MTPEALRELRSLDTWTGVTDATQFADSLAVSDIVARHLWELLADSETVLFEVSERAFESYCGEAVRSNGPTAVVASVEGVNSRNGTPEFTISGASARGVHRLLGRRDRMRKRLVEVAAGYRDEDATALRQVADTLDRRARVREDLDSSFARVSLSADAIETVVYHHEATERRSVPRATRLGA